MTEDQTSLFCFFALCCFVVVVVVFFSLENVLVPWFPDNISCIYYRLNPWLTHLHNLVPTKGQISLQFHCDVPVSLEWFQHQSRKASLINCL